MAKLKLSTNNHSSSISVPTWFIHEYMPDALGGYVKVYLYLLTAYYERNEVLSIEDTAKLLAMMSSDVLSALEYWHSKNVITFKTISEDNFEISFNFSHPKKAKTSHKPKTNKIPKLNKVATNTYIQPSRPNYSPSELSIYLENAEVQQLFNMAEKYIGRLLSSSDLQILFGLYDWLHMPLDLIEYLLDYCTTKGHTNMRYIEKTAISWVDEGVYTLEDAKAKSRADKIYFKILSEVGLGTQNITQVQKEFIDKWLNVYNLSLDIIIEGCRRASAQTKNPSLNYLDTIFTNWHKNKVKSLDDIEKLDKAFADKQKSKSRQIPNRPQVKKTSFNSMEGRDWDFSELEKLENDRMKRLFNEG